MKLPKILRPGMVIIYDGGKRRAVLKRSIRKKQDHGGERWQMKYPDLGVTGSKRWSRFDLARHDGFFKDAQFLEMEDE